VALAAGIQAVVIGCPALGLGYLALRPRRHAGGAAEV
jgi:hypothetical protein